MLIVSILRGGCKIPASFAVKYYFHYMEGKVMWGFLAALVSGALMSIQGVFNTEVTKQSSLWVSTGCLRSGMAFYRKRKHFRAVAGG